MNQTNTDCRLSLVTLMGLPGSGKTTLCHRLKTLSQLRCNDNPSTNDSEGPLLLLVQYDTLIPRSVQSLFPKFPHLGKILRTNFLSLIKHLITCLQQRKPISSLAALAEAELSAEADELIPKRELISNFLSEFTKIEVPSADIIILVDDNNYYKSMRKELYLIAKSNTLGFCVLYPTTTVQACQERNLTRSDAECVPSSVIDDMSKKLEKPNPMDNPADMLCIQIEDVLDPSTHTLIYNTILHTLRNPVQPRIISNDEVAEKERRICAENEVHQADLILRKWIHTELALASFTTKKQALRDKGQAFQQRKLKVLEGLRSGEMQIASYPGDEFEFRNEILMLARSVKVNEI